MTEYVDIFSGPDKAIVHVIVEAPPLPSEEQALNMRKRIKEFKALGKERAGTHLRNV